MDNYKIDSKVSKDINCHGEKVDIIRQRYIDSSFCLTVVYC